MQSGASMFWLCAFFSLALIGCGSGDRPVAVSGSVLLDDQPLSSGKISFITPGQVPEQIDIRDGKFTGKAKLGKRRVEIAAYRPYQIPPEVPASMRPLMKGGEENYLPDIYHTRSTLDAEVTSSGPNEFSYKLVSQP